MGIHFICVDIRGAQYKCFLALLFLQPWGLHEGWLFVHFFFLLLLLCCCIFCTLKPLPSVIANEVRYRSVWGSTSPLAALLPDPGILTAVTPRLSPRCRRWPCLDPEAGQRWYL